MKKYLRIPLAPQSPIHWMMEIKLGPQEIEEASRSAFYKAFLGTVFLPPLGLPAILMAYDIGHVDWDDLPLMAICFLMGAMMCGGIAGAYLAILRMFFGDFLAKAPLWKIRGLAHLPNLLVFSFVLSIAPEAPPEVLQDPSLLFAVSVPVLAFEIWAVAFHGARERRKEALESDRIKMVF